MKKYYSLIVFLVIIFALSIGYAYLSSDLTINGSSSINNPTWNVYWDNVQVTNGSVSGNLVTEEPTIDLTKTTVSYEVTLEKPGDFYEFTVDAKNAGSVDAMIDTVVSKLDDEIITVLPDYLNYSVTYNDGTPLASHQELLKNTQETYKVRIEYIKNIDVTDLPTEEQTLSLEFNVVYVQATADAIEVRSETIEPFALTYVSYNPSSYASYFAVLGSPLPGELTTTNNPNNIYTSSGKPIALGSALKNGIVQKEYIVFKNNNTLYPLRVGIDESSINYKPVYEQNKNTLITVVGAENCIENYDIFTCTVGSNEYQVDTIGNASVTLSGSGCFYDSSGGYCY